MDSMATQKDLALFLKNSENVQKLDGLVQDTRYALMDYQVCSPKRLALIIVDVRLDFVTTRYLRRGLPADREFHFPTIPPFVVT